MPEQRGNKTAARDTLVGRVGPRPLVLASNRFSIQIYCFFASHIDGGRNLDHALIYINFRASGDVKITGEDRLEP